MTPAVKSVRGEKKVKLTKQDIFKKKKKNTEIQADHMLYWFF